MDRAAMHKRAAPKWVKPMENDELEVQVNIESMPDLSAYTVGLETPALERRICETGFVDFRGYIDSSNGGGPVVNTLEARLELLRWSTFRNALFQKIGVLQREVSEGEAVAASD